MAAAPAKIVKKIADMAFSSTGGVVNWFPGHMAAATRAIRDRLKVADLVIEVRDARIPLSSANDDLQGLVSSKRRVIALNKKDLANPNVLQHWVQYFDSCEQDCLPINAHSKSSVSQLLAFAELKLKEAIIKEPTLLIMVLGIPNVGKSSVINSIHQIASSRFPVHEKMKRATVGPLPGVTQDIAGYKIANQPSVYVLDTPGVLVPSIGDVETGLKLALTGAIKDSIVGEERIAQYLLAILNARGAPLRWDRLANDAQLGQTAELHGKSEIILKDMASNKRRRLNDSDVFYIEDLVMDVKRTLYTTFKDFQGNLEDESDLESLIDTQLTALQKTFRIPQKASDEARTMVSKKLLTLFRSGKLGPFILDTLPIDC